MKHLDLKIYPSFHCLIFGGTNHKFLVHTIPQYIYRCIIRVQMYIRIQRPLKTYIVMAKHNSLWFASCPRLCIGGKVGVGEERR